MKSLHRIAAFVLLFLGAAVNCFPATVAAVSTMAELRAKKPSAAGELIDVSGYSLSVPWDRPRRFIYVQSDATPHDNVHYVDSGALMGSYVSFDRYSPVQDIRWFGAVGDGVTDASAAIQSAIDYTKTIHGSVLIPSSTFAIASQLNVNDQVSIVGVGPGSQLKWASGGSGTMISVNTGGIQGAMLRWLKLNGNNLADGVTVSGSPMTLISGVTFTSNATYSATIQSSSDVQLSQNYFGNKVTILANSANSLLSGNTYSASGSLDNFSSSTSTFEGTNAVFFSKVSIGGVTRTNWPSTIPDISGLQTALDQKQSTNPYLASLSSGDASSLTSTGATNLNQLVTLDQLQNFTSSGLTMWWYGRSNASGINVSGGSRATNWSYSAASTGTAFTNSYTAVTNNTYVASFVSARTFKSISSGVVDTDVYAYRSSGTTVSITPECYIFDTVIGTNVFEFNPAPVAQSLSTTLTKYTFATPVSDYSSANNLRLVVRLKASSVTGSPTVSIVTEGSFASHSSFSVPLSDFVQLAGDTMTGTLVVPSITLGGSDLATTLTNKMTASAALTNLNGGNGANLTNVAKANLGQPEVGGIAFDGLGGSVVRGLHQNIGTNDMTIWTRFLAPAAPATTHELVGLTPVATTTLNANAMRVMLDNSLSGTLNVVQYNASSGNLLQVVAPVGASLFGRIHDLVVTKIGTNYLFYLDGANIPLGNGATSGTPPTPTTPVTSTYAYIGGFDLVSAARNKVSVYRTVVWNRALAASEVTDLANNGIDQWDQWGTQTNYYTSSFTDGADGWSSSAAGELLVSAPATDPAAVANTMSITRTNSGSGRADVGKNIVGTIATGKRYRATAYVYNVNSPLTNFVLASSGNAPIPNRNSTVVATNSGGYISAEFVGATATNIRLGPAVDSNSVNAGSVPSGTVYYAKDIAVNQIGAILDYDYSVGVGNLVLDRAGGLTATNLGGIAWTMPKNPIQAGTLNATSIVLQGSDLATTLTNKAPVNMGQPENGGVLFDGTTASTRIAGMSQVIGTNDFSVWVRTLVPTTLNGSNRQLLGLTPDYTSTATGYAFRLNLLSTGELYASIFGSTTSDANTVYSTFFPTFAGKLVDINFTRSGTNVALYVNGVQQVVQYNATGITPPTWGGSITSTYCMMGANTSSTYLYNSTIYRTAVFNRALSQADVTSLVANGIDPADQWGTQTQILGFSPSVLNGGFETNALESAGTWHASNTGGSAATIDTTGLNAHTGNNSMRFVIDSTNNPAYIYSANGVPILQPGKRYRATFWGKKDASVVSGPQFALTSATVFYTTPSFTTNWTQYGTEWVNQGLNNFILGRYSLATGTTNYIDDIEVTRIGAILDYDFTIGNGTLTLDRSSNLLHATNYFGVSWTSPKNTIIAPAITLNGNDLTATLTNKAVVQLGQPEVSAALFDGSTTGQKISGPSQVIGTNDFTMWLRLKVPDGLNNNGNPFYSPRTPINWGSSTTSTTTNGIWIGQTQGGSFQGQLFFEISGTATTNYTTEYINGFTNWVGQVVDLVFTRAYTNRAIYINGIQQTNTLQTTVGLGAAWDTYLYTPNIVLGSYGASLPWYGEWYRFALFNRALNAREVAALGAYGISAQDRTASNVEVMGGATLNGNFESYTGTNFTSWTLGGSLASAVETVDLPPTGGTAAAKITFAGNPTASTLNWFCSTTTSTGPFVANKRFRINFWCKRITGLSGDILYLTPGYSASRNKTFTNSGAWEYKSTEIVPLDDDGTRQVVMVFGGTAGTQWLLDDIHVTQVGAFQDVDLSPGVGLYFPDRSGNNLHLDGVNGVAHTIPRKYGDMTVVKSYLNSDISNVAATTKVFDLPPNCGIECVELDVTQAFDAGTTLILGTSTTTNKFLSATSVAATGITYTDSPSKASESNSAYTSIYVKKSASTTTGACKVRVTYNIRGN